MIFYSIEDVDRCLSKTTKRPSHNIYIIDNSNYLVDVLSKDHILFELLIRVHWACSDGLQLKRHLQMHP